MPAVAEVDPFADLGSPDDLIGGLGDAPAYQTTGGQFQEVPRAQLNALPAPEINPFDDLSANVPEDDSLLDVGEFHDLVPQLPKPETRTEQALLETPEPPRNDNGWYIQPGSLPDRILTWFGGGTEALAKAETNRSKPIPAERPPLALPIARAIDTVAENIVPLFTRPAPEGAVDGESTGILQRMVETRTQEPKPEGPSFLNAGIPLIPPQEGTAAEIAAGVANLPIGFANFLLSPGGVMTVQGLGMMPKLIQTLTGLGFTAEQVKGFVEAETLQDKITTGIGAVLLGTVTGIQAKQLRKPASEPGALSATTKRVVPETPQGAEPAAAPESILRSSETALLPENSPTVEATAVPRTRDQLPSGESGVSIQPEVVRSRPEIIPESSANARQIEPGTEPEIMSPGPGAASAREPLASYELRRFGKRFQETEGIDPAIREATGNRYYEPISNKLTFEEAGKIIEERGTDNAIRLVRDENFAMEPRVRATLAQSLVQKLNQSHAEATAAGDVTRAKGFLDQAVDTAEYLGEFGTRLGQGVQSFAIWSRLTPEGMLESAKRSAKRANVELTPEQQAEIRRLAQEAHEAKEGIPKQDATKKLADYMVKQTGIPAGDLPLSIYYTHILSGVQTHIVNAVDTGLNVMHEVNNLVVSNPRAAASIYRGLMRGLGEGKWDGLLSLQEGRRITSGKFIESPDLLESSKFGEKGGVPIVVKGVASKVAKKVAEARIGVGRFNLHPLNTYKYVMRMMSASDAVFFRGAEEARAGLLAHRLAEATGVERAKLKSEADSILGYDRLPDFRAEAAREGYTGAKAEARATELMIQSRPESLRADAADYAGVSTYNHTPRGVLGYLSNKIAETSNKYPALKLFVPFTRIVANVTNRGLDNTPMGILRALKEKGLPAEERQRVLTRGIMGTTGIIGLGVLNATGVISIHGAGPPDIEKKRQLQNAGWKPFSIQVGDKYYTYTYTPIGLGVSVLGNYLDSQRYKTMGEKDALTRVAYSMSRIGQTVFSQSFLSGLSNLFTILSGDPGRSVNSLKQFFSGVATAAATPNLARDINHLFDPTARKSETIAQDLIRNIPVARLSLKPTLNAFGEPVVLSRNRFFSGQSDDPAWLLVVNKNLRVPVVDQTIFEDNDDGYNYAKLAGQRMKNYIREYMTELQQAPSQQAQDMLSKAARGIFDAAREEIIESGGIKKRKRG